MNLTLTELFSLRSILLSNKFCLITPDTVLLLVWLLPNKITKDLKQ